MHHQHPGPVTMLLRFALYPLLACYRRHPSPEVDEAIGAVLRALDAARGR